MRAWREPAVKTLPSEVALIEVGPGSGFQTQPASIAASTRIEVINGLIEYIKSFYDRDTYQYCNHHFHDLPGNGLFQL